MNQIQSTTVERYWKILPYCPVVINPDNFIITFDVNFTTQALPKFKQSKRFEEIHNLINKLHDKGMSNKEISNYLNSRNIKTPNGKDYTRYLIWMFIYKFMKMNNRLIHLEWKLPILVFGLVFNLHCPNKISKLEVNCYIFDWVV